LHHKKSPTLPKGCEASLSKIGSFIVN
jgi:hypothetical protein